MTSMATINDINIISVNPVITTKIKQVWSNARSTCTNLAHVYSQGSHSTEVNHWTFTDVLTGAPYDRINTAVHLDSEVPADEVRVKVLDGESEGRVSVRLGSDVTVFLSEAQARALASALIDAVQPF